MSMHAKFYPRIREFARRYNVALRDAISQFDIGYEVELAEHRDDFRDCDSPLENYISDIVFDHWGEFKENFLLYYPKLAEMEKSVEEKDYGQKYYATAEINGEEVKIFLIETEKLKKDHNSFVEGGHNIAREDLRFIPEKEIWVDNSFRGENLFGILLHEVYEYGRMHKEKETYEVAHEKAEKVENDYRKSSTALPVTPLGVTNVFFRHFTSNTTIPIPFKVVRIAYKHFKEIHSILPNARLVSLNYMANGEEENK